MTAYATNHAIVVAIVTPILLEVNKLVQPAVGEARLIDGAVSEGLGDDWLGTVLRRLCDIDGLGHELPFKQKPSAAREESTPVAELNVKEVSQSCERLKRRLAPAVTILRGFGFEDSLVALVNLTLARLSLHVGIACFIAGHGKVEFGTLWARLNELRGWRLKYLEQQLRNEVVPDESAALNQSPAAQLLEEAVKLSHERGELFCRVLEAHYFLWLEEVRSRRRTWRGLAASHARTHSARCLRARSLAPGWRWILSSCRRVICKRKAPTCAR